MSSPAQAAASAANALLSTGPRTDAGKGRSSRNAVTHGLTSKQLVIAPGEEAKSFAGLGTPSGPKKVTAAYLGSTTSDIVSLQSEDTVTIAP